MVKVDYVVRNVSGHMSKRPVQAGRGSTPSLAGIDCNDNHLMTLHPLIILLAPDG